MTTIVMLFLCATAWCADCDSVSSSYHKGVFHTHVSRCVMETPAWQTAQMGDSLVAQFLRNPELLYDWALRNTGQQHDGTEKDDIVLVLKKNDYNPKANRCIMTFDVIVPGFKTIKDVTIEAIATSKYISETERVITLDLYTSLVLKHAHGVLHIKELSPTSSLLTMDADVKFGWFFNLFITQKKYKLLAEFRLVKFIDNLKYYAPRPEYYISKDKLSLKY